MFGIGRKVGAKSDHAFRRTQEQRTIRSQNAAHALQDVRLRRHVDRSYLMEPGDTLFFDSSGSHGPEELLESPVQYLSIIIYPRN